ncbi:MAG TPA: hypothetical protein VJ729_01815 [Nitrososphaeraceae archaeon]|nr:hypothetical protein [Nitrososphaeraceae archaeon]
MASNDSLLDDTIQFCFYVCLKEARKEERLVKQISYTMLSAYTNNPINLAINSPTGEGKNYVLNKVGEKFPKDDVMFLAGMTDKALFHRQGSLVIKNEIGEYVSIDDKVEQIDSDIADKESDIASSENNDFKKARRNQINQLEAQKKDLLKHAKKLIDLSHKILVFLDTPKPELFNTLMPLLSHDKYEVEYEYTDTRKGIETKTNILRGWPAVIFAQAIDYSHHARYPEIQRRFIITNPKMTLDKYAEAVDLIADRYGLPDIVYQQTIISDSDKEKAREIIKQLKEEILHVCNRIEPGKNNVIIPFKDALKRSLPADKAFDMTTANRFFGFITLLSLVNINKRPVLQIRKKGNPIIQTVPFALFEDLGESIFLMEYANGVRPYVLEWYKDVFLELYKTKTKPDSRENSKGELLTEKRIAVTTEQLIEKTKEIYKRTYTSKQILETYLTPLINHNYIDKTESGIDGRAKIYYPPGVTFTATTTEQELKQQLPKYIKLFENNITNNSLQHLKVDIIDFALYPDKDYIISTINSIIKYYSENSEFETKLKSHENNELTVEKLVDIYYKNPENYFAINNKNNTTSPENNLSSALLHNSTSTTTNNLAAAIDSQKQNNIVQSGSLEEYIDKGSKASELQENTSYNEEFIQSDDAKSEKLFEISESNNITYSNIRGTCFNADDSDGSDGFREGPSPSKDNNNAELTKNHTNSANIPERNDNNIVNNTTNENEKYAAIPERSSEPSEPSAITAGDSSLSTIKQESLYRLGHSDTWACKNCIQKGDTWFMQQHICRKSSM